MDSSKVKRTGSDPPTPTPTSGPLNIAEGKGGPAQRVVGFHVEGSAPSPVGTSKTLSTSPTPVIIPPSFQVGCNTACLQLLGRLQDISPCPLCPSLPCCLQRGMINDGPGASLPSFDVRPTQVRTAPHPSSSCHYSSDGMFCASLMVWQRRESSSEGGRNPALEVAPRTGVRGHVHSPTHCHIHSYARVTDWSTCACAMCTRVGLLSHPRLVLWPWASLTPAHCPPRQPRPRL